LPQQREDRDPGILGDIKWALKRSLRTTKWMLVTVIAPEICLGKYWADVDDAKTDLKMLEELAAEDEVPWTMSHSLFANMGGFVLRRHVPERVGRVKDAVCQTLPDIQEGGAQAAQHSPETEHWGNIAPESNGSKPISITDEKATDPNADASTQRSKWANPYHLNARDIVTLRTSGVLSRLPYLTSDELQDRSKSDSLVRLIAIGQILWIIIQILVRAARHLAISQLEIAVVAFACCAVAMYGLNWNKPKGVQVPITILQYSGEAPKVVDVLCSVEKTAGAIFTSWMNVLRKLFRVSPKKKGSPISNDFNYGGESWGSLMGMTLGSLAFGGIHLAAWNFEFPTKIEQILWRIAALWCTCIGLIMILCIWMLIMVLLGLECGEEIEGIWLRRMLDAGLVVLGSLYVAARLYLVVEMFRTLCFLPPDAYVATWAVNVPHVA
jgi:hypothetical protein